MKQRKRILAVLMSCTLAFSALPPMGAFAAETALIPPVTQTAKAAANLALTATMSASGYEAAGFTADKANDGNSGTRWACAANQSQQIPGPHWLAMDFGSAQKVSSVTIHWERKNPTDYAIQYSNNGQDWEDIVVRSSVPEAFKEVITFDTAVQARHIRVLINSFNSTAAPEGGSNLTWGTVSDRKSVV